MRIVIEGYVEKFVVPGIKMYIELFFSRDGSIIGGHQR